MDGQHPVIKHCGLCPIAGTIEVSHGGIAILHRYPSYAILLLRAVAEYPIKVMP